MKKFNLILMLTMVFHMTLFDATAYAARIVAMPVQSTTVISAVTSTGAGSSFEFVAGSKIFHATGFTSAGSGAATVKLQCSMTGVSTDWVDIVTVTLTLATTQSSDLGNVSGAFKFCRGNVTALSGTGATVSAYVGN